MRNDRLSNSYDIHTAILSNEEVAEAHYLLRCECAEIVQHARPGQFIHVMISQGPGLLLRRPFTIYTVEGHEITMLYQIIGEGTKRLSEMPKGASLQVLGPLGNTFNFTTTPEPAILVGGGAGIASLMLLAVALRKNGIETVGLVGAQHHARLLSVVDLESIGITVHIATDDGSVGHHGYITDILAAQLKQTDWYRPNDLCLRTARDVSCCHKDRWRFCSACPNCHGKSDGLCNGCMSWVCLSGPYRQE